MRDEINFGCSEEFAELCALATSGCLSVAEEERLEAHVAVCAPCALLLNQYRTVASTGMAKIAAMRTDGTGSQEKLHNADHLKAKLLSALAPLQVAHATTSVGRRRGFISRLGPAVRPSAIGAVAAIIVVAVACGYLLGIGRRVRQAGSIAASFSTEARLNQQLAAAQTQLRVTKQELAEVSQAASLLQTRSDKSEKDVKDLQDIKAALEMRIQELTADGQHQNATVAELATERDALSQKLRESEGQLQSVRLELKAAQDDRQRFLLRTSTLESQVDRLSAQLRERDDAARRSEQYLASDRDVRELMGARQLYIADVFDVDPQGKTRKPFGRVFYTKGKSLIFYAFDLDQQPGYRDAKAFQAWGRPGSTQAKPVSLGIFYLDSEKNRRWALKFDDPKVLQEIDALFVTVEPNGGSKRPTNKPFLLAYLHTAAPNHP